MLQWLLGLFKSSGPAAREKRTAEVERRPVAQEPPPFPRHEAILDRSQQVAAYVFTVETLAAMRDHAWQEASRKFSDSALIEQFVTDTLAGLLGKRLAFLPLSPSGLEVARLDLLPKQNLVIEFDPPPEEVFDREAVLARLTALHDGGSSYPAATAWNSMACRRPWSLPSSSAWAMWRARIRPIS